MESFTKLLEGIATLAWPLIVVALLVILMPAIAGIAESAKSRKFTLKVGGQELTMDEISEQQRSLISDLQTQLLELRDRLDELSLKATIEPVGPTPTSAISHPEAEIVRSVLWVDDFPKNNSYFIEQLHNLGVSVDLARSTDEGLSLFKRRRYTHVISDMGRNEEGFENPDAGIDLLKEVRDLDPDIPFLIFCSSRGVRRYGEEARQLGAKITTSATELAGMLNLDKLKLSE